MANPFAIYCRPSDDLAPSFTPTVSAGVVDPDYPVANGVNGNQYLPVKATGTSLSLDWDLSVATQLGMLWLWHTNLTGSASWKTNAAVDFSGAGDTIPIVLPGIDPDGYYDNPKNDLSAITPRRYLRLVITGNAANVILGGWNISTTKRQFVHGHQKGLQRVDHRYTSGVETVTGARMYYDWGVRERDLRALSIITSRSAGFGDIRALFVDARARARQWPIAIDPAVNSGILVNFDQDEVIATGMARDTVSVGLQLREASRGLAWS